MLNIALSLKVHVFGDSSSVERSGDDSIPSSPSTPFSGAKVRLTSQGNKEVKIVGIDDYGYLKVVTREGDILMLQPDGNTFDIMKGLIAIKLDS